MSVVYERRVERQIRPPAADSFWLSLLWRIETVDGRDMRRTLIDPATGEILDDVWMDPDGQVRSYNAFDRTRLRPPYRRDARLVKPIEAERRRGPDDQVVDHGGDDRPLPRQGQLFPTPT